MTNCSIFLDSGAFSASTCGITIDINDYITYIKEHIDSLTVYANLDVIGDAEGTWQNQLIMEAAGLKPIPCFHSGEDFSYLDRYIENYEYMALGGMVGGTKESVLSWLDSCWERICDSPDRLPRSKVHGFGMTNVDVILRYPWWSVDSSSWLVAGRFGSLLIPRRNDYTKVPWKVFISNRSPKQAEEGAHLDTFTPLEQKFMKKYIKDLNFEIGKSEFKRVAPDYKLEKNERWCEEDILGNVQVSGLAPTDEHKLVEIIVENGLCNNHILRDYFNFLYYMNLEKNLPQWPQPFTPKTKYRTFNLDKGIK